ncbi:hypothetical protein BGZ70_008277, partial [Mortierella alpina]
MDLDTPVSTAWSASMATRPIARQSGPEQLLHQHRLSQSRSILQSIAAREASGSGVQLKDLASTILQNIAGGRTLESLQQSSTSNRQGLSSKPTSSTLSDSALWKHSSVRDDDDDLQPTPEQQDYFRLQLLKHQQQVKQQQYQQQLLLQAQLQAQQQQKAMEQSSQPQAPTTDDADPFGEYDLTKTSPAGTKPSEPTETTAAKEGSTSIASDVWSLNAALKKTQKATLAPKKDTPLSPAPSSVVSSPQSLDHDLESATSPATSVSSPEVQNRSPKLPSSPATECFDASSGDKQAHASPSIGNTGTTDDNQKASAASGFATSYISSDVALLLKNARASGRDLSNNGMFSPPDLSSTTVSPMLMSDGDTGLPMAGLQAPSMAFVTPGPTLGQSPANPSQTSAASAKSLIFDDARFQVLVEHMRPGQMYKFLNILEKRCHVLRYRLGMPSIAASTLAHEQQLLSLLQPQSSFPATPSKSETPLGLGMSTPESTSSDL